MDALVDASPDAQRAVGAMDGFAAAICGCKTQACAAAQIERNRSVLDDATAMSAAAARAVLAARVEAAKCLAAIGYQGAGAPGLAAKADAMVADVCACKDQACRAAALKRGGRFFADALTPDDMAVVRDATGRASKCAGAAID
jgi:hypothetical protein